MRFLVDEALSPIVAVLLAAAGHDAVHVRNIGLKSAPDGVVLAAAVDDRRVLLTLDADFGALVAASATASPSVVLFRGNLTRRPDGQVSLLIANLDQIADDLAAGAIVVIGDDRLRVRRLPIS